jgi:hypothetical protein
MGPKKGVCGSGTGAKIDNTGYGLYYEISE